MLTADDAEALAEAAEGSGEFQRHCPGRRALEPIVLPLLRLRFFNDLKK